MSVRKVFLVGFGSFNPPTIMHLRMFDIGRDHLESLTKTRFQILGGILSPTHDKYGKKDLAPSLHRLPMSRLALSDHPYVRLSEWECAQTEWTRTRAVLDAYQAQLENFTCAQGDRPEWLGKAVTAEEVSGAGLMLLCGDDLLESFNTPGVWSEEDIKRIVSHFGLVVLSRGATNSQQFVYKSDTLFAHKENIHFALSDMGTDISSTKIRLAVRRGHSVRYLVHPAVIEYMAQHGLYKQGSGDTT